MTRLKPIPIEQAVKTRKKLQKNTRKKIAKVLTKEDKAIKSLGQKLITQASQVANLSHKKTEALILELQKTILYIKKRQKNNRKKHLQNNIK